MESKNEPVLSMTLHLQEEMANKLEVWRTRMVKEDGSNPENVEVICLALGMFDLYMHTVTEKKVGEETFLAIVTETDGKDDVEIQKFTIKDFRIAQIIV